MGHFAEAYLARHGITSTHTSGELVPDRWYTTDPAARLVSSAAPGYGGTTAAEHAAPGDFLPRDPTLANKLEEAKRLPGLESSEDLAVIHGGPVTHLTQDVTAKLDARYGKDKWIVKAYGDDAAAGYGIYFPQRAEQIRREARAEIADAGHHLAKYGFELERDESGRVVGLRHQNGDRYRFGRVVRDEDTGQLRHVGSAEYEATIYDDARHWADRAAFAAGHEQGAMLPGGGTEFMAQPAFDVVGVSEAERAAGRTIAPGEGRVHVVTRGGKAEVVPHATWIKGEHLPVVFETGDTRAMAEAARKAIEALPESERQGQIYAPDVLKAADGYKVVEANPANHTGSSGYLGNNPLVIDAYVSHLTGRTPGHVRFVRQLLTRRAKPPAAAAGG